MGFGNILFYGDQSTSLRQGEPLKHIKHKEMHSEHHAPIVHQEKPNLTTPLFVKEKLIMLLFHH